MKDYQPTLFDIPKCPQIPEEYKGKTTKSCGYTESAPIEWTEKEIEWIKKLKKEGWDNKSIAESVGRTEVSISVKMKRIGKKERTYNSSHIDDKYNTNLQFMNYIKPNSVLDMFSGSNSWWKCNSDAKVVTNDANKNFETTYNEKAEILIHKLYYQGFTFDVIDLDPFGSAYDCFDTAIKMAKRGLVITFGEMGHKRFKRLDFVRRYYDINSLEEFTIGKIISEVQKIASRNKKTLTPIFIKEWNRICRVYFEIGELKITEQWTNK